ncbi:cobalamin biosynthesis protein CobD/CbiB [Paraglaciecola hydrolytica]|uniref:Cobalamin biosynthesis protein CbiB n=1 Tax=Paraglaciecola hydrolytica TaxID=1799789 RepID=A0A136A245_9ALTE|nr:cobalamin biosynthesis protein [Paraglaciecola hydrolytica]KXI29267.1 hypothetical protein AX660_14070 [Paraglaciecola hydrolytica]
MNDLISELSKPQLFAIYSVIIVVCVEKWLVLPEKMHPLTFARLIAQGMAYKVSSRQSGNALQQSIAGTLAPLVLLNPFIVVLALLMYLAEYPIFFESLLLFVALRFKPIISLCQKIHKALSAEKKALARQQLQNMVLRQTASLSALGMTKACIESLLLRFSHQYCTVIIVYLVGGGIAALTYRLLFEFSHSWHCRLPRFEYFGKPVRRLMGCIQYLPARFASLSFMLVQSTGAAWRVFVQKSVLKQTRFFILNGQGAALGVQLGGPVYYAQDKLRLAKCGGSRLVRTDDISRTVLVIQRAQWVFLMVCIIVSLLLNIGS